MVRVMRISEWIGMKQPNRNVPRSIRIISAISVTALLVVGSWVAAAAFSWNIKAVIFIGAVVVIGLVAGTAMTIADPPKRGQSR